MMWAIKHKSGRVLFVTSDEFIAENRRKMGWIVEEVRMTSREQFEEYAGGRLGLPIEMIFDARNGDRYLHAFDSMNVMQSLNGWWAIWQASRAAIEIKLPNQACLATWHYAGSPPDDFYEDIEISRNPSKDKSVDGTGPFPLLTKWEVEQAIESAGLKVKK